MRKDFLFILLLICMGFLAGCRASKESKARSERTAESEIGVELRKADSLWSSIAERLTMKIEFYPQLGDFGTSGHGTEGLRTIIQKSLGNGSSLPAAPPSTMPAAAKSSPLLSGNFPGGGMGAVKSIEIFAEKTEDKASIRATDSVSEQKTATTATLQEEKASEARQDNGTVATVCIVFAVAALIYLCIKQFVKK